MKKVNYGSKKMICLKNLKLTLNCVTTLPTVNFYKTTSLASSLKCGVLAWMNLFVSLPTWQTAPIWLSSVKFWLIALNWTGLVTIVPCQTTWLKHVKKLRLSRQLLQVKNYIKFLTRKKKDFCFHTKTIIFNRLLDFVGVVLCLQCLKNLWRNALWLIV